MQAGKARDSEEKVQIVLNYIFLPTHILLTESLNQLLFILYYFTQQYGGILSFAGKDFI